MFQLSIRIAMLMLSTAVAITTAGAQGNLKGGAAAAPAPRAAPQQFARPSQGQSPSAIPRQAPTPKALAGPTQPKQQIGGNVGGAASQGGNRARQQAEDASARVGGNLTPQNQPGQNQQGQKFQLSGANQGPGNQPAGNRVLSNQTFANRPAAGGVAGNALARATFQGSFAGQPWRHHNRRHHFFFPIVIGWVGPLFWPYAYSDFVGYTFYPYAYDTFWPNAYDDVYEGMFGRYAYRSGGAYAAVGRGGSGRPPASRGVGADLCSGQTAGLTDWPIEQIAQTVAPDDNQRATLDELKAATAQSLDILKASCPTELPSTPTGRLEAMHKRLAAMLQAVQTVRPALDKLYQSLNDEQKARFNAIGPDDESQQQQTRRDLAQVCSQRAAGIAGLPTERIERAVRPDAAQRGALTELQDATAQAIELLKSDCPTYRALTPVGRLQAMEQRLDAMLRAVQTVQPALERFYGALSDEQKERFNRLGPAQG
jgi:LTXXQ motif family protein